MRLASLGLLVVFLGCSHEHDPESTVNDACSDGGAYERDEVTDEACRAFVEAEGRSQVVTDAAKAPAWTSPALGTTKIAAAPPPKFAWTKGTLASTTWKKFLRAIDPLPNAWAHGDTTGDAFVLTFRDSAGKELHRVMTTSTEYTPSAANWDAIRAKGTFAVTLTGVRYTVNVISSGTKPTAAEPRTFTVE